MSRKLRGEQTSLTTTNFNTILSGSDSDVQLAMETLDDHVQLVTNGGTGLTTMASPGSLLYVPSSDVVAELPLGDDGYVLKLSSGMPLWQPENVGALIGSGAYQRISFWQDATTLTSDGYFTYDEVNKTQISKTLITDAYVGPELVANGDFAAGSASWVSTNPPFTFASNRADKVAGTLGTLVQAIVYSINITYLVSLTVNVTIPGVVTVTLGNSTSSQIGNVIGATVYRFVLSPTATTSNFTVSCDSAFSGYFDNISVKRIYESKPFLTTKSHNNLTTGEMRFPGISGWSQLYNSAYGLDSMKYNTTGSHNTAAGYSALKGSVVGSYNAAFGVEALTSCGTGGLNTAVGYRSLYKNVVGESNTGMGYYSLGGLQGGTGNVAVGSGSLASTINCNYNIGIGMNTFAGDCTGDYNIGIGTTCFRDLSTGTLNIGIGDTVLYRATNSSNNVIIGHGSAYGTTSGQYNVGVGNASLKTTTDSSYNTFLGHTTLEDMTTGASNTAVGYRSINSLITGDRNTAMGSQSMAETTGTDVDDNTAIGYSSLVAVDGVKNTAVGSFAGETITTSTENTLMGYCSMQGATDGYSCATFGAYSLYSMTTCRKNTAIGYGAMQNAAYGGFGEAGMELGAECTAVGYRAYYGATGYWKAGAFGAYAEPGGDYQIKIGDGDITVHMQNAVVVDSDERVKDNIIDINVGLSFINNLKPRSYKYKNTTRTLPDGEVLTYTYNRNHWGFIAQEIKETLDKYEVDSGVYIDSAVNGGIDLKGLRYEELIAPMVKAIQEQQVMINDLQKEISELKNK